LGRLVNVGGGVVVWLTGEMSFVVSVFGLVGVGSGCRSGMVKWVFSAGRAGTFCWSGCS
jgi:hypothetical protein